MLDKLNLWHALANHLLSDSSGKGPSDFTHVKSWGLCILSKGASADACFTHPPSV